MGGSKKKLADGNERPSARPNVVLIISDDQSWTDYSFMGHDTIETPRLDELARQSITFRRGYVPTSLCRPSLVTIISGQYPHHHGITGNDPAPPANGGRDFRAQPAYQQLCDQLIANIDRIDTLPRLLDEAGYRSHQSGKWWEGNHRRGGFTAGMTHGDPTRGGRHGDDGLKIGRQGLQPIFDFVDADDERPFFLWYAPFLPHTPHNPPPELLDKYRADGRPIELAKYYAMCEWFDQSCGELLDFLDQRELDDNTIVVYVTDNGWIQRTPDVIVPDGWRPSFSPASKQSPNEGGVRTPIMFRWPSHWEPRMDESTLVSSIDLMPTILAACGIDSEVELPGSNLVPFFEGQPLERTAIFGEGFAHDIADINDPSASLLYRWCIQGRWKLIQFHPGKLGRYQVIHARDDYRPQLYDLLDDPHETRDVASEHESLVDELKKLTDQWWTGE